VAGDDRERKRLIGGARRLLERGGAEEWLADLADDLYARVSLEDLGAYSAEELAGFVCAAAALLAKRTPGEPLVRLGDPDFARDVTLVEILNDNMPFLVDSVLGELQDFAARVRLVTHPIVAVERDGKGRLTAYRGVDQAPGAIRESLIQVLIDRIPLEADRQRLADHLRATLDQVRLAVAGWRLMLDRLKAAIAAYETDPPPIPAEETAEAIAFLEWLRDDNFTFLGMREYDYVGGELKRADKPALGILADPGMRVLQRGGEPLTTTPALREFLLQPEPLIIAKANLKTRVHRRVYLDYVGVKLYGADGALDGELRIVGLFTSTAYTRSVRAIPFLRRKAANLVARAGFDPSSHSGKALINVVESYPRDELFQADEDTLFDFAMAILALEERPRVRVLSRVDKFDRFVSVIVYVPRDRYDSNVRMRIGEYLAKVYDGHVSAFYPAFPEGVLARVHFIIGRSGGATPQSDRATLEAAIAAIVRTWNETLAEALRQRHEVRHAELLMARYRDGFPPAYRDDFPAEIAVADIDVFERLRPERPIAGEFSRGRGENGVELKLVHLGAPIALSERVPMLENMGFRVIDERTYEIRAAEERPPIHLHIMELTPASGNAVDLDKLGATLIASFMAVWYGHAESDGYNALTVNAGLAWRDIAALRTVSRWLRQAGVAYSQTYMWTTLNAHPEIAKAMVEFFHARFDPNRTGGGEKWARKIIAALEEVKSLDEDRIITRFVNVIAATVRTNFFQLAKDGAPHGEISLKIESPKIEELPEPKPFREMFVYSPKVEAIHLRFGRVARGGIRWSDRPQDFRTEILGLAKAQQVKNAVIVPVGAKGGFVPKGVSGPDAYRQFISSLLDITDNLDGDVVVPPEGVRRHDDDDPYLVVAADKGTATFSDTANAIALSHDFWLGDAFASGGSAGYDHKDMGITARGAWEAVKRHFRELDIDIQTTPFTVVGVGDMSGDVFGNAMLLSPATKLVAAFDHRDIFVDPDPDPAMSLAERQRLFRLQRSSWQDYDRERISAGGGVFPRHEKSIKLSRQMCALLELDAAAATPQEIIRAILKAEADLLFFGGIGTFVRAVHESDERVGDRANDAVRITGNELRVRVVGEGANLAMTQGARIEYGLAGGRCNSDAIDNSAGVNTSDVEVNIKIAFGAAVREGKLDLKKRNQLLASMTGEVAALVLRNNYLQPLAISLDQQRGFEDFAYQQALMQDLERRGRLDRAVAGLPDDAAMLERQRAGRPLTRAEIGVLLAHAKLSLSDDLEVSDVADEPALAAELFRYFPSRMQKPYRTEIEGHRLRRDIIATGLSNAMINRGGPTYLIRVAEHVEASPAAVARAYVVVRDSFGLRELNDAIDELDNKVPGMVQLDLYRAVEDLLLAKTPWFLRNVSFADGIAEVVAAYGKTVSAIAAKLGRILPTDIAEPVAAKAATCEAVGVPAALAGRIAALPVLGDATDIHLIAADSGAPILKAASTYFEVAETLQIARIESLAGAVPIADAYDRLAIDGALTSLAASQRKIAAEAIAAGTVEAWLASRKGAVNGALGTLTAMAEDSQMSVSRVTVAADLLASLVRG
jgi:glutamate dehydrogenase